jgi:pantothenate kinase
LSDFIDYSVYVDATTADIRHWYVERFLRLRETAFRDPDAYFGSEACRTSPRSTSAGSALRPRAAPDRASPVVGPAR